MTLREIADVVGGRLTDVDHDVSVVGEAFADSREPVPGGLFVALDGDRVDGHAYAAAAVADGAAAALAARPVGAPAVVVEDVLGALGLLAAHVVRQLPGLTVVAITGSQGKTTTKDMLGTILSAGAPTVAARESQNNELGVPLTALRILADTRYVVSEMGARGVGHIAYLTRIMRPRLGVVLNVGSAHLGEFGSREAIAEAKGELVEALPPDGVAILNADDRRVLAMAARTRAEVTTFGRAADADLRVSKVALDDIARPSLRLEWRGAGRDLELGYVGEHQAMNAAAAVAAAVALGLSLDEVADRLHGASPRSRWRMEISTSPDGVVVINDAYNANPDSMRAGLVALADIAGRRSGSRTVAVLGEMRELGEASRLEHERLGRVAAGLGIAHLVAVGAAARPVAEAARADPEWHGTSELVDNADLALEHLRGALREGDVVLVKASRAAGLEGVAAALLAEAPADDRTDGGR